MSDSISDFITVIRNAYRARKDNCSARYSNMHWSIAQILKQEGFIRDVREGKDANGHKCIEIVLKYVDEVPALTGIQRQSTPGRRLYYSYNEIPRVLGGLGVGILTTSKGVMNDRNARRQKVGGEMVCSVW
ncbi:MAG: 30S ribosomal protein S8 [Opitutales bacterium]|nr:30S ribosomal protein S8 [Opitutales bacterium]